MKLGQINRKKRKIIMDIPLCKRYEVSEAYHTLRSNLLFRGEGIQSLAMVSCTSGEGTTSVVWKLALSLAEAGKNVLVIDADMRKPVNAEYCRMKQTGKGLSEFLSGSCTAEECVFPTSYENLYALPAGHSCRNCSELLTNDRLHVLMAEVREVFDYILVDCPPLSNAIDGALAAKACDASVIVLEADKAKRSVLQGMKTQLEKADSRILGVILNKFDSHKYRCYGNYYGKSYGKAD